MAPGPSPHVSRIVRRRRSGHGRWRLASALAVGVLAAAAMAARQQPNSPPQQPTFKVQTTLVRVDVYPTANGRPVPDLTAQDFDVSEDGVPQAIVSFEHVVIRPGTPRELRDEPHDLRESVQMARDPRTRLFVVYLDSYHVTDAWGWRDPGQPIRGGNSDTRPARRRTTSLDRLDQALVSFLDHTIGPDDMVAALTPDMDPRQITFTRRGTSIDDYLHSIWARDLSGFDHDPEEDMYEACYNPLDREVGDFARKMIVRRREEVTLRTLRGLVQRLGELRPERKALLLVTEGWSLFRPDASLARAWSGQEKNPTAVHVGPDGKPATGSDPRAFMRADQAECERIRQRLANMNSYEDYRALLGEANRANVSLYPINPGVRVNTRTGFTAKTDMLADMASATDGLPLTGEFSDIGAVLQRIADDLSQYYLIGYYSTNPKTDGKYRTISVKVKRPGVDVRTRPGYLALSEAEARANAGAAAAPVHAETAVLQDGIAALDTIRADRIVRLDAGHAWRAMSSASPPSRSAAIWVVGELDREAGRATEWQAGATAVASVVSSDNRTVCERTLTLSGASRTFSATLSPDEGLQPDTYTVRLVVQPSAGGLEAREALSVTVPVSSGAFALGRPRLARRGPFTGPQLQPTADARLRRQETMSVDVPVAPDAVFARASAEMLDRSGKPLPLPLTVSDRTNAEGRWISARIALAPLARGDYAVRFEFEKGSDKEVVLRTIRILP